MAFSPLALPRIYLIRHGETEWALSGRHTSRTELPLTSHGEAQAARLAGRLAGIAFSRVLTSPRFRARHTCELAGLGAKAEIELDLREWDYGDYEGRKSAEIRAERETWNLFTDGAPGGESPVEVYERAASVVRCLQAMTGDVAVFSHGHFLRVLAMAWTGLPVLHAQRFGLATASLGLLSFESDQLNRPIISLWNETEAVVASR